MSLQHGASDLLGIAETTSASLSLLRDFLLGHGDRVVHFSCEAYEVTSTGTMPMQGKTGNESAPSSPTASSPTRGRRVPRLVVITDSGFLCVPRTSVESGIFFDCRVPLETLSLVIVGTTPTTPSQSATTTATTNTVVEVDASIFLKSTVPFSEPSLAATLVFETGALRKTFLLALCIVKPSLPILQRRPVDSAATGTKQMTSKGGASAAAVGNNTAVRNNSNSTMWSPANNRNASLPMSPNPREPGAGGDESKSPYAMYARWSSTHSQDRTGPSLHSLSTGGLMAHNPQNAAGAAPVYDLAGDVFALSRDRLHDILHDTLDPNAFANEQSTARPAEEDPSRASERESIRAMLDHREKKIIQNIEFRLKYPTKPATRVRPGVEFDKAHEERLVLPDDIPDDELLGPALWSLWSEWKRTGGLLALPSSALSGGGSFASPSAAAAAAAPSDWNVYLSSELIDSLKAKEDELFGIVGPKSTRKLRTMRDLVNRERTLFRNREPPSVRNNSMMMASVTSGGEHGSPASKLSGASPDRNLLTPRSGVSSANNMRSPQGGSSSKPKPFRLSQSTLTTLHSQVKLLERQQLVHELKSKHDVHVQSTHHLHVDHIQRQINRLSPERR